MNVRVPFNFTTWNKVVYTSGYVITCIIKTTEPNHLILILNLANKSYFIIKVKFCHLLAWFKNYDPLKVGVNSFWDTLYNTVLKDCTLCVFLGMNRSNWRHHCANTVPLIKQTLIYMATLILRLKQYAGQL